MPAGYVVLAIVVAVLVHTSTLSEVAQQEVIATVCADSWVVVLAPLLVTLLYATWPLPFPCRTFWPAS